MSTDDQNKLDQLASQSNALRAAHADLELNEFILHDADQRRAAGSRLQRLICAAIPIYNMIANLEQWPELPVPSFCGTNEAPTRESR